MVQEYGKLITSDSPNSAEDVAASLGIIETLEQGDSEVVDNKIHEPPNIGFATQEEDHMSEFTQYIGYVQETNGYYNYWPVCVVRAGSIERFDEGQEVFPKLGNVNLSSTPWDYVRRKCSNGEILVITLSSSDLIENIRQDGYFQRTNYKVNFNQLERDGRIKRLKDIGMYPVLHPLAPIDFAKKSIAVKEKYVDTKDLCLIEESNILYGPYQVSVDEDDQTWVNINSAKGSIVTGFCSKNGKIDYTEIDIDIPGYPHIITYASGTVLAKNIFSVYCLQAFRLHKIERPSNSPIPGQAVKPPAPLFLQGQVSLSRLSFSPPLFPAPDRFAGTRQRQH